MNIIREEVDYVEAVVLFGDDPTVSIQPWSDRLDHLKVTIIGIENTPFAGGSFSFEIKMPSNYPYSPPYCFCETLIVHPRIDPKVPTGRTNVCITFPEYSGTFEEGYGIYGWSSSKTLADLIQALKELIQMSPPSWNPSPHP
jgi:ubiquitin-protein ligase